MRSPEAGAFDGGRGPPGVDRRLRGRTAAFGRGASGLGERKDRQEGWAEASPPPQKKAKKQNNGAACALERLIWCFVGVRNQVLRESGADSALRELREGRLGDNKRARSELGNGDKLLCFLCFFGGYCCFCVFCVFCWGGSSLLVGFSGNPKGYMPLAMFGVLLSPSP